MIDAGSIISFLLEIKGDTLTMCWAGSNKERPAAFKSDDGQTLIV